MDYDMLLLAVELAALAIAIAFGIWRLNRVQKRSHAARPLQRAVARAYDMRRDGQRLSMD